VTVVTHCIRDQRAATVCVSHHPCLCFHRGQTTSKFGKTFGALSGSVQQLWTTVAQQMDDNYDKEIEHKTRQMFSHLDHLRFGALETWSPKQKGEEWLNFRGGLDRPYNLPQQHPRARAHKCDAVKDATSFGRLLFKGSQKLEPSPPPLRQTSPQPQADLGKESTVAVAMAQGTSASKECSKFSLNHAAANAMYASAELARGLNSCKTVVSKHSSVKLREYARPPRNASSPVAQKREEGLTDPELMQVLYPAKMRLKELTHQCLSVRVDVLKVSGPAGWHKDELAERLQLVLAVGQDMRILKLTDLTGSALPQAMHLILDGVLSLTPLYVAVHKSPMECDVSSYHSQCAEAKLKAAQDSRPGTRQGARMGSSSWPASAELTKFDQAVPASWEQLCIPLSNSKDVLRKLGDTEGAGEQACMVYAGQDTCLHSQTVRLDALVRGQPFPLEVKLLESELSSHRPCPGEGAAVQDISSPRPADLQARLGREKAKEAKEAKAKRIRRPASQDTEASAHTQTSFATGNPLLRSAPRAHASLQPKKKSQYVSHFTLYSKKQLNYLVFIQKMARGFLDRCRVNKLKGERALKTVLVSRSCALALAATVWPVSLLAMFITLECFVHTHTHTDTHTHK